MSTTDNKALIKHYFEVMSGVDTGMQLGDFFTEDIVWHIPQSSEIAPNPRKGRAAVMELLGMGVGFYEEGSLQVNLQRLVAEDDRVVAQFSMSAKLASGPAYNNDYIFLFSLRDGKISEVWEALDTLYMAQLAGGQ